MTFEMEKEKAITQDEIAAAFSFTVFDSEAQKLKFEDIFTGWKELRKNESRSSYTSSDRSSATTAPATRQKKKVLIIFIRHFFCGNCQEYLRELAAHPLMRPENLEQENLQISIVGCGTPSLIASYRAITNIPESWLVYADPSTELYKLLGMHRTLSMGTRRPQYIRRSLTGNMLRSVWQGVKRIREGDVLEAGSWDVNGGEFLFEQVDDGSDWKISWCYKMTNSRDHTEAQDLLRAIGLTTKPEAGAVPPRLTQHQRTKSSPMVLENLVTTNSKDKLDPLSQVKRTDSFRRSLSLRRQSWMNKNGGLGRVISLRAPRQAIAA